MSSDNLPPPDRQGTCVCRQYNMDRAACFPHHCCLRLPFPVVDLLEALLNESPNANKAIVLTAVRGLVAVVGVDPLHRGAIPGILRAVLFSTRPSVEGTVASWNDRMLELDGLFELLNNDQISAALSTFLGSHSPVAGAGDTPVAGAGDTSAGGEANDSSVDTSNTDAPMSTIVVRNSKDSKASSLENPPSVADIDVKFNAGTSTAPKPPVRTSTSVSPQQDR